MDNNLKQYFIEINKLLQEASNNCKNLKHFEIFIHNVILDAMDFRNKFLAKEKGK